MFEQRQIRRRAGASAEREYERGKREWRDRNRVFFHRLAIVCGAIIVASLLVMGGEIRGWICGLTAGMALAFVVLARETPPAWIGNYQIGAVGEERTAKALAPLLRADGSSRTTSTEADSTSTTY